MKKTLLSLSLLLALTPPSHASDSLFSPEAIKSSMIDLYCKYPEQPAEMCPAKKNGTPPSSAQDTQYWALELFDQIAMMDADPYNEVMSYFQAEYRLHPEHWTAIETVLTSVSVPHSSDVNKDRPDHTADAIRARLRAELAQTAVKSDPVVVVLDDLLYAFSMAYALEFGRGAVRGGMAFWETRGQGLSQSIRFKQVAQWFFENDKVATRAVGLRKLAVGAAGMGLSLTELALEAVRTDKVNPIHLLEPVQTDIVRRLGIQFDSTRGEIHAMRSERPEELKKHAVAYFARAQQMVQEVSDLKSQWEHMKKVAEFCHATFGRPELNELTEDLQKLVDQLDAIQSATSLD